MTLAIFLEICFKICDRDVGMFLAALLLVNNHKNENYRKCIFRLEFLSFFLKRKNIFTFEISPHYFLI